VLDDKSNTDVYASKAGDQHNTAMLVLAARADTFDAQNAFCLIEEGIELGRRASSNETLRSLSLDDRLVSARHARIVRTDRGYELCDLDSKNGTFVDGRRICARVMLRDHARILIGGHVLVFRQVPHTAVAAIVEETSDPLGPVPTRSPELSLLCQRMRRLASARSELLLGETGVGKEVYARAMHRVSGRTGEFIAINCAALPNELVESELFGYAAGAHSMARQAKVGLLEHADGGTLFLDEIGDMHPGVQAKLLRFLQSREFTPLGSTRVKRVELGIIAATHCTDETGEHRLRCDLAARLSGEPLVIPPLRSRIEDLGNLIAKFVADSTNVWGFEAAAMQALCLYDWPRNVRELETVIREALLLRRGTGPIELQHLPSVVRRVYAGVAANESVSDRAAEPASARRQRRAAPSREQLERLLRDHRGNVADVARALDRQWAVVHRWIKRQGFDANRYRK